MLQKFEVPRAANVSWNKIEVIHGRRTRRITKKRKNILEVRICKGGQMKFIRVWSTRESRAGNGKICDGG